MKKLFLTISILFILSLTTIAQTESRIIKMDKPDENDDKIYLEITSFKIGDSNLLFNESFTANENWLKDVEVKVKNVSGKPITCVAIGFGLLEGITEELRPNMSWGDKLGLYYGDCSEGKKKKNKTFLKNGEEAILNYSTIDDTSKKYFEKIGIGKFHKAQLLYGTVKFKNGEIEDTYWRVPNNVRIFDEEDEN